MIRAWLDMKKKEIIFKRSLYSAILPLASKYEDLIKLLNNLYIALKDVPLDELRSEFIGKLAEIIHSELQQDTE